MTNQRKLSVEYASSGHKEAVRRLLQLYLYDLSGFAKPSDDRALIDDDGRFEYAFFDDYWEGDPKRKVYLFRLNDSPAGFAFLCDWSPSGEPVDWIVSEIFVARKYRRSGVGRQAAKKLFGLFRAVWEVGVADYNAPALLFWREALLTPVVHDLVERTTAGKRWTGTIFRFSTQI